MSLAGEVSGYELSRETTRSEDCDIIWLGHVEEFTELDGKVKGEM